MQLSNQEAVPMILSLIAAGRTELAVSQLTHMAKLADAFGKELEIVVLPHDELTGQFQILVVEVGGDTIVHLEPISRDDLDRRVQLVELAYPAATTVHV